MSTKTYGFVAERAHGETVWSITFLQLPGVTSVTEDRAELVMQT